MATLLTLAIIMITIGGCMLIKGDDSSIGRSCMISSESRLAIKKSNLKKIGRGENFCTNSNVFVVNKYGIALTIGGLVLLGIYLIAANLLA